MWYSTGIWVIWSTAVLLRFDSVDFPSRKSGLFQEAIRILLAYACAHNIKLYQMAVKSAFLNGYINELVYVEQTPGFEDEKKPNYVYCI